MNQYLLFMYYKEDPAGGWEDFLDDFNDLTTCYEEIDRRINLLQIDSDEEYTWHIVDIETCEIIDRD